MIKLALTAVLLFHGPATPPDFQSLVVHAVFPDGGAAAAGIQSGDRLVRLDGKTIGNLDDLQKVMATKRPGETIPVTIERRDAMVELPVTLGEARGGASIGVSLVVFDGKAPEDRGAGTAECLEWVEETYRIESLARELGLDASSDLDALRSCIERDTATWGREGAVRYCDNIFKIHCSGLDLITEIGEAGVEKCEQELAELLGASPAASKSWKTCGQHKVFDDYSREGKSIDRDSCKAAFLECTTG